MTKNRNKTLSQMIQSLDPNKPVRKGKRVMLVDGLNLFFRNFAVINKVNSQGTHIGGLGGFFRSLGFLINHIEPDEIYVVCHDHVGTNKINAPGS